jgi:hypothetical protein
MRRTVLVAAAAIALGGVVMTPAFAQHHGGGGGFGGGHAMSGGGGGMGGMHAMGAPGGGNFAAPRGNVGGNFAMRSNAPNAFTGPRNNFAANGWSRGGHDFDHDHGHFRRGFIGPNVAFGSYGPDYYDYYNGDDTSYGDSCWQRQLVQTPYGLSWQMVDVCEQ